MVLAALNGGSYSFANYFASTSFWLVYGCIAVSTALGFGLRGKVDVSDFNTSISRGEGDMVSTTGDLTCDANKHAGGSGSNGSGSVRPCTIPRISACAARGSSEGGSNGKSQRAASSTFHAYISSR